MAIDYSTIETEDWRRALLNNSSVLWVKLLKYICEGVSFLVKLQATHWPSALKMSYFPEVFLKNKIYNSRRLPLYLRYETTRLLNGSVPTMFCHKHKGKIVSKKTLQTPATVPLLPMLRSRLCITHILTS